MPLRVVLTLEAEADITDLLQWSEEHFGEGAAKRYESLLIQAIADLQTSPNRIGSRFRNDLQGDVRSYALAFSRTNVLGARVKTPRHTLFYRVDGQSLRIIRVLHESRDVRLHLLPR